MLIKIKDGQKICLLVSLVFVAAYIGANCANNLRQNKTDKILTLEAESLPVTTFGAVASTTSGSSLMISAAPGIGIVGLSL